ncbi:MAG: hypothetical protein IPJ03_00040 [Ignavibacteriales bacterium]|nr:hypothetical protein [Ignavibacteriales bacterium]
MYYYSVFMRTYIKLKETGVDIRDKEIVEIGPGYSLGVGFCFLLLGAKHYTALDVIPLINEGDEIVIFKHLIKLFKDRTPIPEENEFSGIYQNLNHIHSLIIISTMNYWKKS